MQFKPALKQDIQTLASICLQTADDGNDATRLFDDASILTDLYITPYFYAHCGHCMTITYNHQISGYAVAVYDTAIYSSWLNREWLPRLRLKYPRKKQYISLLEQSLFDAVHQASEPPSITKHYPSHAHISLLPHAQHQGVGTHILNELYNLLSADSTGLHVQVSQNNTKAHHFFTRNGFHIAEQKDTFLTLTRSFRQQDATTTT